MFVRTFATGAVNSGNVMAPIPELANPIPSLPLCPGFHTRGKARQRVCVGTLHDVLGKTTTLHDIEVVSLTRAGSIAYGFADCLLHRDQ